MKRVSGGNSPEEFEFVDMCAKGIITISDIGNFLSRGVDIDAFILKDSSYSGQSAMSRYLSSQNVQQDVVECFLSMGANPKNKAIYGHTPLSNLCLGKVKLGEKSRIIQLLIEKGADPNSRGYQNESLLHGWVKYGTPKEVETLLKLGAIRDINHRGKQTSSSTNSYTPIQNVLERIVTSYDGFDDAVRVSYILIKNGADLKLNANHSFNPINAIELMDKMESSILEDTNKESHDFTRVNAIVDTLKQVNDLFTSAQR